MVFVNKKYKSKAITNRQVEFPKFSLTNNYTCFKNNLTKTTLTVLSASIIFQINLRKEYKLGNRMNMAYLTSKVIGKNWILA